MIKETRYHFYFDCLAKLSPWWLLLLIPAAVALMWFLYRRQLVGLRRRDARGLTVLRMLTVALAALLLFQPELKIEEVTDYGGRFVSLVDNSPSMGISDSKDDPVRLVGYARRAGRLKDDSPAYADLGAVDKLRARLRGLYDLQVGTFNESDAYWEYVQSQRVEVLSRVEELKQHLKDGEGELLDELMQLFGDTIADADGTRE
ncbi:MAG: hypothetical protein HQL31_10295, partial [Planctomycetes bacterium]|nr:hypothetical protein [Planctomycetota bacterium]